MRSADQTVDPDGAPSASPWWGRPSAGAWELAAVLVFTLWIAWPFVEPGSFVTDYDTLTYSGPNLEATYRAWGEGRMPWWEPGVFGGTAFGANLQTAIFYPLKLVFWPFGAPAAMGAMTAVHLFLLALGMRHLARRTLGLAVPAGFVAAAVMVGAGSTMVRSVRFEQIAVIAWLPWLLVAIDAVVGAVPERRWRAVGACAGVVAVTLLAGHPQQVHLSAVLAAVWLVGRVLDRRARARADADGHDVDGGGAAAPFRPWAAVGRVAAAGALGVGVSAVALVLALPLLRSSAVPADELAEQASFGIYVLDPLRMVPSLFGDLWAGAVELTYPTAEAPAFLGVAALALALVGTVVALWRRPAGWSTMRATASALAATGAVSFLMAFGPGGGVYRLAAIVVPGVSQGRVPLRWLLLVTVAVAVFAAVGSVALTQRLLVGRSRSVRAVFVGLGVLALAAIAPPYPDGASWGTRLTWLTALAVVAGAVTLAARPQGGLGHRARRWATAGSAAVAVVVVIIVELGVPAATSYGRELRRDETFVAASVSEISTFLAGSGERYLTVGGSDANTSITSGARTLEGYDGGLWLTEPYVALGRGLTPDGAFRPLDRLGDQVTLPLDADALAAAGVRYVVIDPATDGAGDLLAVREALVPGWIGPLVVEGTREVWENPRFASEAVVYPGVVGVDGMAAEVDRTAADAIAVTVPDGVTGTLVLAEQAQAGWTAAVDGTPQPLVDADGFALAVEVPPGTSQVTFAYRPPGLAPGLAVSALSLVLVVLLVAGVGDRLDRRIRRDRPSHLRTPAAGSDRS